MVNRVKLRRKERNYNFLQNIHMTNLRPLLCFFVSYSLATIIPLNKLRAFPPVFRGGNSAILLEEKPELKDKPEILWRRPHQTTALVSETLDHRFNFSFQRLSFLTIDRNLGTCCLVLWCLSGRAQIAMSSSWQCGCVAVRNDSEEDGGVISSK